jgi:hypothetical protein
MQRRIQYREKQSVKRGMKSTIDHVAAESEALSKTESDTQANVSSAKYSIAQLCLCAVHCLCLCNWSVWIMYNTAGICAVCAPSQCNCATVTASLVYALRSFKMAMAMTNTMMGNARLQCCGSPTPTFVKPQSEDRIAGGRRKQRETHLREGREDPVECTVQWNVVQCSAEQEQ